MNNKLQVSHQFAAKQVWRVLTAALACCGCFGASESESESESESDLLPSRFTHKNI